MHECKHAIVENRKKFSAKVRQSASKVKAAYKKIRRRVSGGQVACLQLPFQFCPTVFQSNSTIKHRFFGSAVRIGAEISQPFKLHPSACGAGPQGKARAMAVTIFSESGLMKSVKGVPRRRGCRSRRAHPAGRDDHKDGLPSGGHDARSPSGWFLSLCVRQAKILRAKQDHASSAVPRHSPLHPL